MIREQKPPVMFPFSAYHVATSHNSYLRRIQCACSCLGRWSGTPSGNVQRTLRMGARMIEIDVHELSPGRPVVSHAADYMNKTWFGSSPESFRSVVFAVREFMEEHPTGSPIILDFEFGSLSIQSQDQMADDLEEVFRGKMVSGRLDFRTTYPEDLLGRVLMTCGGGTTNPSRLRNYMNVLQRDDYWFRNRAYPENPSQEKATREWLTMTQGFARFYPKNVLVSSNQDGVEAMRTLGVQAAAMNYGWRDHHLKQYIKFFQDTPRMVGYRLAK